MTLAEVPGTVPVVVMELTMPTPDQCRLAEFGLRRGARVEVLRHAPFGGPVALRVAGGRLALRRRQAAQILVAPEPVDG